MVAKQALQDGQLAPFRLPSACTTMDAGRDYEESI
jgi:hypothetical protein